MFLLALGHAATHWTAATIYILLPLIKETLGLSYAEAGVFLSVFHLSSFFANFASGIAVDMSGRRVLVQIVALIMGGVATFVFGFTSLYVVLVLMVGYTMRVRMKTRIFSGPYAVVAAILVWSAISNFGCILWNGRSSVASSYFRSTKLAPWPRPTGSTPPPVQTSFILI